MTDDEKILQDVGRKCADDVMGAISRNQMLVTPGQGDLVVALYAASAAFGAVTGTFSGINGGEPQMTEQGVDKLWTALIRPMILGNLAGASHEHG